MAISLVQHRSVDAGSVSSAPLAYVSNEGAGNTNLVAVRIGSTPSSVTVTDNNGNTYVADVSETTQTDHHLYIFRASNVNSGACTVTVAQTGGSSMRFAIYEYTTNLALDQTNKANGATGTARSSGSITTTTASELLLTATAGANTGTDNLTIGNAFAIEDDIRPASADALTVADRIVSATLTVDGNWTSSNSQAWDSVIASYSTAGGATDPFPAGYALPRQLIAQPIYSM